MKYLIVICATLVLVFNHCEGQSGQISSKLDFDTSETSNKNYDSTLSSSVVKALVSLQTSSSQKEIISSKPEQNSFNLRSIATSAVQNPKTDFTSLGVICVDGKCNTTEKGTNLKGDQLSTDILVQVVTNVDNKKDNKSTAVGEDDDVPIVVGYSGTNIKPNGLQPASRRVDGTQDVTITTGTDNTNKYNFNLHHLGRDNDVLPRDHRNQFHQVPHFEPSFNNHYFGEAPPPQYVWYRRRNGHNPLAFNSNPRPYKINQWQLKYPSNIPRTNAPNWSQTTTCSCTNPGLNWYPSFGPHQPTPAPPINDKMDPLRK